MKKEGLFGGILFILTGLAFFFFRPFQACGFFDVICKVSNFFIAPLFIGLAIILIIIGLVILIRSFK